jgi:acyl carrier protein
MTQQEVFAKVVSIIEPFAQSPTALAAASMETSILEDLKVNSARLVDVVLEIEEIFDIQVSDEQADSVRTLGNAVHLIMEARK